MKTKGMLAAVGWITSIILSVWISSSNQLNEDRQLYIVYMGSLPGGDDYQPEAHHNTILQSLNHNIMNFEKQVHVRSYTRSINGFAAWLTDKEVEKLRDMKEVISVFPNEVYHPVTTRSWDFMRFPLNVTRNLAVESDIIIGLVDTGIASDSPSFSDEGLGPIPKKWKGYCKPGVHVVCNKKVIGAQRYDGSTAPAEDDTGHGTHTASIAAGNIVQGASLYNIAKGTARGGVPSARIAMYKVCGGNLGCDTVNVLASFDHAIADGVDILSVSLGFNRPAYFGMGPDVIALGAYHALEKGILTVQAAGNDGYNGYESVKSLVPWLLTVGAATTDRQIVDMVVLGNGNSLTGRTINSFASMGEGLPLIYGQGKYSANCTEQNIRSCDYGCLDPETAKGKIVLCDNAEEVWNEVSRVGGAGVITQTRWLQVDYAKVFPIPGVVLTPEKYMQVQAYVNSTAGPTATLLKSISEKNSSAPNVASFSARGPNKDLPDINKPDLVAPGVEILAGYSSNVSLSRNPLDQRFYKFNILSGTSMACPHVAGAAAYVKSFHPDWSPSAIKSALMTSARPLNATANPDREFAYGSGHIDPQKAIRPGLIYDLTLDEYEKYICTVYGNSTLGFITGHNASCPDNKKISLTNLNYPSMTFPVYSNMSNIIDVTFERAVTNVGPSNSTYMAMVSADPNLKIEVFPNTLSFKSPKETLRFTVKVTGTYPADTVMLSSSLVWFDGSHLVRSPIVVYKKN